MKTFRQYIESFEVDFGKQLRALMDKQSAEMDALRASGASSRELVALHIKHTEESRQFDQHLKQSIPPSPPRSPVRLPPGLDLGVDSYLKKLNQRRT